MIIYLNGLLRPFEIMYIKYKYNRTGLGIGSEREFCLAVSLLKINVLG